MPKLIRQVAFGAASFSLVPQDATTTKLEPKDFIGGEVLGTRAEPRSATQVLCQVHEDANIQLPISAAYDTNGDPST